MHGREGRIRIAPRILALLAIVAAGSGCDTTHEPPGFELFESPQVAPIVVDASAGRLYVATTVNHSVGVIDTSDLSEIATVPVGLDPVALALRPGANELWVSNHVSDSVSIVDLTPQSPTQYLVIDTVQAFDAHGVTLFDEPAGIAFTEDGEKAYVALSSRNEIAVIDADTRTITKRIPVRAQEPRAIAVRNGLLYVTAFESGNGSELGVCAERKTDDPQCGLGFFHFFLLGGDPNLRITEDAAADPEYPFTSVYKNIVLDEEAPDRDLFVYDTETDTEIDAVSGVGTLLYGLAVSSTGRAFIAQTDARNTENGIVGPPGSRQDVNEDGDVNLKDLGNRMFTNEIAAVTCTSSGCGTAQIFGVEPENPDHETALATPYGIAISDDDSTLVVTAMGSSRVFTVDATSTPMQVLSRIDLGSEANGNLGYQSPRGVALVSDAQGRPQTAYVLNTLEYKVSVIDVSDPEDIVEVDRFEVGFDPLPPEVSLGRIAFHNAFASSSGTFSCASCHPDAHTDQLLWRIGGECVQDGCVAGQDQPRTTMPIRGLKHTLPLHWDGTLGDPFGGPNGRVGIDVTNLPPSCSLEDDHGCFLDIVRASLAGVMCDQDDCDAGPSMEPGLLTSTERDAMASYLPAISYPPARSRRIDDTLSTPADPVAVPNGDGTPSTWTANALAGFQDFFTDQNAEGTTCAAAGCHELPLGVGTNSGVGAFDAPTVRGLTDRVLQFSFGATNTREVLEAANPGFDFMSVFVFFFGFVDFHVETTPLEEPIQWSPSDGYREITTFGASFAFFEPILGVRPLDLFQMFEEASTGHSGAYGRQVQLNARTTSTGSLAETEALMETLEEADARGLVNLVAIGVRDGGSGPEPIALSYRDNGFYENANISLGHAQLIAEAQTGDAILTLTAAPREGVFLPGHGVPRPLLGPCVGETGCSDLDGDVALPNVPLESNDPPVFSVVATDVHEEAKAFVDGQPVQMVLVCDEDSDTEGFCNPGTVTIELAAAPPAGLHLLQLLNPAGPISNELPLCVGTAEDCNGIEPEE